MDRRKRRTSPSPCPTIPPEEVDRFLNGSPTPTITWSDSDGLDDGTDMDSMELESETKTNDPEESPAIPVCRMCKQHIWPVQKYHCHFADSGIVLTHYFCSFGYWHGSA